MTFRRHPLQRFVAVNQTDLCSEFNRTSQTITDKLLLFPSIALLERVFLRIGTADTDEQLQAVLAKFLPPVLLKLASQVDGVRKKVSPLTLQGFSYHLVNFAKHVKIAKSLIFKQMNISFIPGDGVIGSCQQTTEKSSEDPAAN